MTSLKYSSEITWKVKKVTEYLNRIWADVRDEETFKIEDIVRLIEWAYLNNETVDITVDGKKGSGKTTLALTIAALAYARRGTPDWERALEHLYFKPTELLLGLTRAISRKEKVKVVILDDAGAWMSKWTISGEKEAFFEAMELSRTLVGGIIYTHVASLAKHLRLTANLHIRVERLKYSERVALAEYVSDEVIRNSLLDRNMRWSRARVYTINYDLMYNIRFKKQAVLIFPVRLPDKIYKKYIQKRHEYTGLKLVLSLIKLAKANPSLVPEVLIQADDMGVKDIVMEQMCRDRELKKVLENLGEGCGNVRVVKLGEIETVG